LADVERAVSLDPRGLDTPHYALAYQQTLRRYDKVEALWQVIASVRPLSEEKRWLQAEFRFTQTGSLEPGEALLSTYSPEALRTDARTVAYASSWYYVMGGDAVALIRLWQESGPNWRYSNYYSGFDLWSVADPPSQTRSTGGGVAPHQEKPGSGAGGSGQPAGQLAKRSGISP